MFHPDNFDLSLEQKFALTNYQRQAEQMPREQLIELFVDLARQNMIINNVVKHLVREMGL